MTVRRYLRVLLVLSLAAPLALLAPVSTAPVDAQTSTGIRITDDSASITVVAGVSSGSIRPGRATGPRGPIYRCDLWTSTQITEPWTLIRDWSSLVPGEVYGRLCVRPGDPAANFFDNIIYDPANPSNDLGVTTRQMRDEAAALLPLDPVIPQLSPDGQQITGVETWIWPGVDRMTPVEYASAGGVEVAVRGRLTEMTFDPGDGEAAFTCADFDEWTAGATNPACSYTYLVEPDAASWSMNAETTWAVDWQDDGAPFLEYGVAEPDLALDVPIVDLEAVIGG